MTTLITVSLFLMLILLSGTTTVLISRYSPLFEVEATTEDEEPSNNTEVPDNPNPKHNTDKDGTSDYQDTDDDNDGKPDPEDQDFHLPPFY